MTEHPEEVKSGAAECSCGASSYFEDCGCWITDEYRARYCAQCGDRLLVNRGTPVAEPRRATEVVERLRGRLAALKDTVAFRTGPTVAVVREICEVLAAIDAAEEVLSRAAVESKGRSLPPDLVAEWTDRLPAWLTDIDEWHRTDGGEERLWALAMEARSIIRDLLAAIDAAEEATRDE